MTPNIIDWAKAQRLLMELQAAELAKTADDKTIVALAIAFPYYVQEELHKVGDIRRDPDTNQPKRCAREYDGAVQTGWTIKDGTLWYAYHGISKETAYPFVHPTGAHDMYKAGEWATFEDGRVGMALKDTVYSPDEFAADWQIEE